MIAIVDYGIGNLGSAAKAFRHVGAETVLTGDPDLLRKADTLVLPGDGAFGAAMDELRQRGLLPVLQEAVAEGRTLLGICVGMQLLFEASEEGPVTGGVGALPGKVRRLGGGVKIPHIGWNQVTVRPGSRLFAGLPDGARFYFVHSYAPEADGEAVAAACDHGGRFAAAVESGDLFGTQFHPEKSGHAGLALLANFVDICRDA
jgi:imidazole glycerol-phosphate synthase subunit HisH